MNKQTNKQVSHCFAGVARFERLRHKRPLTGFACPNLWTRSKHCSSAAGFQAGSMRNTRDAVVRFRPTPPLWNKRHCRWCHPRVTGGGTLFEVGGGHKCTSKKPWKSFSFSDLLRQWTQY